MRRFRFLLPSSLLLLAALPCEASRVRRGPTSAKHKSSKLSTVSKPRAIGDERATQIQNALVKAGYLQDVSGHWDAASEAAMQKLQSDNGWQTKLIPDSRALIKLGLGPNAPASSASASSYGAPDGGAK